MEKIYVYTLMYVFISREKNKGLIIFSEVGTYCLPVSWLLWYTQLIHINYHILQWCLAAATEIEAPLCCICTNTKKGKTPGLEAISA